MLPGGVLFGRSFSFSLSFELCRMRFRISISSPTNCLEQIHFCLWRNDGGGAISLFMERPDYGGDVTMGQSSHVCYI